MSRNRDMVPDVNCVEYVMEDGRRFAWSESNVCYEEVEPDGASFTMLRLRLNKARQAAYHLATRRHPYDPGCEACVAARSVISGVLSS